MFHYFRITCVSWMVYFLFPGSQVWQFKPVHLLWWDWLKRTSNLCFISTVSIICHWPTNFQRWIYVRILSQFHIRLGQLSHGQLNFKQLTILMSYIQAIVKVQATEEFLLSPKHHRSSVCIPARQDLQSRLVKGENYNVIVSHHPFTLCSNTELYQSFNAGVPINSSVVCWIHFSKKC